MAAKEQRKETVMTRFSQQELVQVEELRKRVNCTTNGKMFRNIILTVASHPEFDFLAQDMQFLDFPEIEKRLLIFEKISSLISVLEEENILNY